MRIRTFVAALALVAGTAVLVPTLHAQGKGRGHDKGHHEGKSRGKKVRVVTIDDATLVTRRELVRRGYTVVRVERVRNDQVIYYYRGNNGRGRGHGPMERVVIRPEGERVVFVDTDPGLAVDLRVRLEL